VVGLKSVAAYATSRAMSGRAPHPIVAAVAVAAVLGLNIAIFLAPFDYHFLGAFAYPGAFLITLIANAAVIIPIPYLPVVAHVAQTVEWPALVVVVAALGSVLGESVAYAVGRAEEQLLVGHPFWDRLERVAAHRWRTALVLFLFAAPPNPVFDVGGIAAGALGVRYYVFFWSVFAGRLVRFAVLVLVGFAFVNGS
jgi:membrane protein YqaA with SNARE-associated domain